MRGIYILFSIYIESIRSAKPTWLVRMIVKFTVRKYNV